MAKPVIAISVGDLNGVGIEIALKAHVKIKEHCMPLYFTNYEMLERAAKKLGIAIPQDIEIEYISGKFPIKPGTISKKSGEYSYRSFKKALDFTAKGITDALVTLPIHKKAWAKAGIPYPGHTEALRDYFKKDAIMMLGKPGFFVALFTDHIPLKDVPKRIKTKALKRFLKLLYASEEPQKVAVLGLNPHAGDGGVIGNEEKKIAKAIDAANKEMGKEIFCGPVVPDIAFTPQMRERFEYFVAIYHDQGLAPLKALYFDEAINVSLGLPIVRSSPDHGTAFDIAYKGVASTKSYENAIMYAIRRCNGRSG